MRAAEAGVDAPDKEAVTLVAEALARGVDLLTGRRPRPLAERPDDEQANYRRAAMAAMADRIGFMAGGALMDTVGDAHAGLGDLEDEVDEATAQVIRDQVSRIVCDAVDYYAHALVSAFHRTAVWARRRK